jgi:hypothetical protein
MPEPPGTSRFNKLMRQLFGWSRSSSVLLGGFLLTCGLIVYVWWPLAQEALATMDWDGSWWKYMDWLLVGIFAFMTLTIISHANISRDALIVFVGMLGGLAIESWGTQTNLWHYYTAERPPLWIIPAWPIASLSIDRITRLLGWGVDEVTRFLHRRVGKPSVEAISHQFLAPLYIFKWLYWGIFIGFFVLMIFFVFPTLNRSFTILALLLVLLLVASPTNHRMAVLTFLSGSGLGYFLELWGTTRQCWTYFTFQTPPFFAVLAHGMAAVAFWRAGRLLQLIWKKVGVFLPPRQGNSPHRGTKW